jgi:hypothetical protein
MKAKLIKTDKDNYILVDSTKGVYDKGYLIGSSRESDVNKLSKQNCDEVFGVVDVDKLAEEETIRNEFNSEKYLEISKFLKEESVNKSDFKKIISLCL